MPESIAPFDFILQHPSRNDQFAQFLCKAKIKEKQEKARVKTSGKILGLVEENPNVTIPELAE
jgi:hypothetical protein